MCKLVKIGFGFVVELLFDLVTNELAIFKESEVPF